MRWLAELEHHKVGNVDDVVDRANPDAFNFRAQPGWTWPDFHVVDLTRGIEWALVQRDDLEAFLL